MQRAGEIIRKIGQGNLNIAKDKPSLKSDQQTIGEANGIFAKKLAEAPQLALLSPEAQSKEITRLEQQLVEASADIRQRLPLPSELSFMAKHLVQVTLPHSDPGDVPLWSKANGILTLVMARTAMDDDGNPVGYPYGVIPRLLLYWITSEAVRNKNRADRNPRLIELGRNLSDFMRDVGLDPKQGGGKRSDAYRLKDQMDRLFSCSISFQYNRKAEGLAGKGNLPMPIAPRRELWWDVRDRAQGSLWQSWIELGEEFYSAVTTSAVPVDVRALRALRKSPLALDLYGWATYKAFSLFQKGQSQFISYKEFMKQFGTDYNDPKNFKKKLIVALKKVQAVYPQLKIQSGEGGLTIHPSRPAVPVSGVRPLLP